VIIGGREGLFTACALFAGAAHIVWKRGDVDLRDGTRAHRAGWVTPAPVAELVAGVCDADRERHTARGTRRARASELVCLCACKYAAGLCAGPLRAHSVNLRYL